MRLIATGLVCDEFKDKIPDIVSELYRKIPAGVGSAGAVKKLTGKDLRQVLERGSGWAVQNGFGDSGQLEFTEEGGCLEGADFENVSERARERGATQVGTLGSGNHFLEVDVVDEVFDRNAAETFGLREGNLAVFIHCGSRGLGYQVCDDHLQVMGKAMRKYAIELPDRQLACAPLGSPEAERYLSAMACAANYAWANRQVIMALAEQAFLEALNVSPRTLGFRLVYDVCHNIAKFERHSVDGRPEVLCVHRKGATRAFPPGSEFVPAPFRRVGQPVLIPGDMGTGSYVLAGTQRAMDETFGSSCHGAGRVKSRTQALKQAEGRDLFGEMRARGVTLMASGRRTVAEEMPEAYKNIHAVVDAIEKAGLSTRVARLRPVGVVKG